MKDVFSLSSECIGIWWYPELESTELRNLKHVMKFTNLSILETEELSFEQALFRFMKYTHIR
jgi:hypothetical protein